MNVGRSALVALCLLFSGCCSAPFNARDIGEAPAQGGVGDRLVSVQVLEDGKPASDARVIVFWAIEETDSKVVIQTLALRGPGSVTARVPSGHSISVAAAAGAGYTEEWIEDAFTRGGSSSVEVDLYPIHASGSYTGTWFPAAVTLPVASMVTGYAWKKDPVIFDQDEVRNVGYADRIDQLDAELAWTNTMMAKGDLGLTYGRDEDIADSGNTWDNGTETSPGTFQQFLSAESVSRRDGGGPLLLGPSTKSSVFAPTGLDYAITYEVRLFEGPLIGPFCSYLNDRSLYVQRLDPETGEVRRSSGSSMPGFGFVGLTVLLGGLVWFRSRWSP